MVRCVECDREFWDERYSKCYRCRTEEANKKLVPSFWGWLGNGFKTFLCIGGWVCFPLIVHFLLLLHFAVELPWTLWLWLIPFFLSGLYQIYKTYKEV